jgi:hypothetical protein
VGDKPAFMKYVEGEIEQMLTPDKKPTPATTETLGPTLPIPDAEGVPSKQTPAIPVP